VRTTTSDNTAHHAVPNDTFHIFRFSTGQLTTSHIRDDMQQVMQENAAVYRTQETLAEGKRLIDITVKSFRLASKPFKCANRIYTRAPLALRHVSHSNLIFSSKTLQRREDHRQITYMEH
jgi:succinate dehydrogenase/fumarate reductase flavoprotein subunit